MNPIAMTVVLLTTLGAFAYSASRRFGLLKAAAPDPDFSLGGGQLLQRIENLLIYVLGQNKMPKNEKYRAAGIAHIGIFAAFQVLAINSVILWVRGYDASFDVWGLFGRGFIVGDLYNLLSVLAPIGLGIALASREPPHP